MALPKINLRIKIVASLVLIFFLPLIFFDLWNLNLYTAIPIIVSTISLIIVYLLKQVVAPVKKLEEQRVIADKSAELLIRKDLLLRKITEEMGNEKVATAIERNKLAVVMTAIDDGILALGSEGRINMVNSQVLKMLSLERENLLGKYLDEVLNIWEESTKIPGAAFLPQGKPERNLVVLKKERVQIITIANKKVDASITSSSIAEGAEVGLGTIITIHDISQAKDLEETRMDFVSMAAHELRTPLTSLRGYLSVFIQENKAKFNADQNMFLNHITVATQQLANLTENLLNVSRIEKGTLTVTVNPLDWVTTIKQVVDEYQIRSLEKQMELTFLEPTQPFPPVAADKVRITEVISNLLSNAINYTPVSGTIKVWLEPHNHEIITHVEDNGQGIAPDVLPKLFNKFFRASRQLDQGAKGSGLGLYISKAIVELHHGRIWATSEVGQGSVFSFSIPLASPSDTTISTPSSNT